MWGMSQHFHQVPLATQGPFCSLSCWTQLVLLHFVCCKTTNMKGGTGAKSFLLRMGKLDFNQSNGAL